ncbi:MAG: NAD(P)H-hydrate epimerase [Candidatus Woesearchaeota archaeon]
MITSQQMQELEDYAESKGVSTLDLMENAGREFVKAVKNKYESQLDGRKVVIFCGTGNNAGDGFVAARYFAEEFPVIVILFGDKDKLKEEAKKNFLKLDWPITIVEIQTQDDLSHFRFQEDLEMLLIDALLGTGVQGDVREPISVGIDLFNKLKGIKVAVDLPSGLNPDTGELASSSCKVDFIVTFHDLKVGMEKFKKKTVIVDIGIPKIENVSNSKDTLNLEFDEDDVKIEKAF